MKDRLLCWKSVHKVSLMAYNHWMTTCCLYDKAQNPWHDLPRPALSCLMSLSKADVPGFSDPDFTTTVWYSSSFTIMAVSRLPLGLWTCCFCSLKCSSLSRQLVFSHYFSVNDTFSRKFSVTRPPRFQSLPGAAVISCYSTWCFSTMTPSTAVIK